MLMVLRSEPYQTAQQDQHLLIHVVKNTYKLVIKIIIVSLK